MKNTWILAENQEFDQVAEPVTDEQAIEAITTVPGDPNAAAAPRRRGPFGGYTNLIFLGLMFLVFYMLIFRGPRKKQQEHQKMVKSLKKNDKVRTIGGIIGTIVDIKDDEITLKVDEANNTKIKVAPSAVGKNVSIEKNLNKGL